MTNVLDYQLNETPKQVALTLLDKDAKVRLTDKIQTQQMIHRGQKLLHRLVALKNNKLFGRNDPVDVPDDNINIDSPVTNHHHHTVKESSIGKLLLGAGLLATGIGAPIGAAILMSGAKDVVTPVIEKPVEKPPERPAVNIGGYELRLGK